MHEIDARVSGSRSSEEFDRLDHISQQEVALTQSAVAGINERVIRAEADRFFDVWESFVGLAQKNQRLSDLADADRVVGIERDSRFQLNLRFIQPSLQTTENPQRKVRFHIVRIRFEHLQEQLFSAYLIVLKCGSVAPSRSKTDDQDLRDSVLRNERFRVEFEGLFE